VSVVSENTIAIAIDKHAEASDQPILADSTANSGSAQRELQAEA
jgi:hypothetical protein